MQFRIYLKFSHFTKIHTSSNNHLNLLTVNNLTVRTEHQSGPINILDNLNFKLESGKSVGVVGESGCGKSMAAFAIMGLLPGKYDCLRGSYVR